jgi:hypothetical protein
MKIRLRVEMPDSAGFEWSCNETTVEIGRDPACRLSFPAGASNVISSRHARLELSNNGLWLRDMNSSNGTFVNGAPVLGAQALQPNDRVQLGKTGPILVVQWFDQPQPIPNSFGAMSVPAVGLNHAGGAVVAPVQASSSWQLTPLSAVLLCVTVLAILTTVVVLARAGGDSSSGLQRDPIFNFFNKEQSKQDKNIGDLNNKIEKQQNEIERLKEEGNKLRQENDQLRQKVVFTEKWRPATFFVTDHQSCATAIQVDGNGGFRLLQKAEHPWVEYVDKIANRFQIPRLNRDAALARKIYETAAINEPLNNQLTESLCKYWKTQRYVPIAPDAVADYVTFFDVRRQENRIGLFRGATSEGLEFYPVGKRAEKIQPSLIDPQTAHKATAAELKLEPQTDILDLFALGVAQSLGTPDGGAPSLNLVAIEGFDVDWLDEFVAHSKEPDKTLNDVFFDFVARARGEKYVPDSRKQDARDLRVAAAELRDAFSRRLGDLGVDRPERERENRVRDERNRAKDPDFEAKRYDRRDCATHQVIGEIGKPTADGKWRFAMRLVELNKGLTLWDDVCDIERRRPPEVGSFFLDSGRTAMVTSPMEKKLLYVESGAKRGEFLFRDPFGLSVRSLDTDKIVYDWVHEPIPINQRMNAIMWHLARNLLPRAGRVVQVDGTQALVSLGASSGLKRGTRCKVWRIVNSSLPQLIDLNDWRILPIEVSANEVTDTQAKVSFAPTGLEGLWPDIEPLKVGDIVVRKDAPAPFVAICPLKYDEPTSTATNSRWMNNPQRARTIRSQIIEVGEDTWPSKVQQFLTKQHVTCADTDVTAQIITCLGTPNYLTKLPAIARQNGLTHVIHGHIAFENAPMDSEGKTTIVVKLSIQILDVRSNQAIPSFDLPITTKQIVDW